MFLDNSFKFHCLNSLNIIIMDYKMNTLNHKYSLYKNNFIDFKTYHSYNDIYMNYIKLYNDIYYHHM